VNRFTGGTEIRHFVMAVTSTGLMTKGWPIIFACLLIGAGAVFHADPIDSDRIHVIDGDNPCRRLGSGTSGDCNPPLVLLGVRLCLGPGSTGSAEEVLSETYVVGRLSLRSSLLLQLRPIEPPRHAASSCALASSNVDAWSFVTNACALVRRAVRRFV
jgi:hypothetical protein